MTGDESFILKVKSANTGALEKLLGEIRSVDGVTRTVTKVVLSTAKERQALDLSRAGRKLQCQKEIALRERSMVVRLSDA